MILSTVKKKRYFFTSDEYDYYIVHICIMLFVWKRRGAGGRGNNCIMLFDRSGVGEGCYYKLTAKSSLSYTFLFMINS